MYDTKFDKWMVVGGWVLIILIVLLVIYGVPVIERAYAYVGEKVPFLGRLFAWANEFAS